MGTYRFRYGSEFGWANGEAPNKLAGSPATFDPTTAGVDLYRSPGELRASFASTSIGGATVTDNIQTMIPAITWGGTPLSRLVYAYGDAGRFYSITDAATPVVTLIGTVSNYGQGMAIHKDYVYLARSGNVQRYGDIHAVSPGADATYVGSLTSSTRGFTPYHALHSWKGYLYIADINKLKRILGSESTGTSGTTAITLDADLAISAIGDNNTTLYFGAGEEINPSGQTTRAKCYLFSWNGTDLSFTDSFLFPESFIHAIRTIGQDVIVWGKTYVYRLVGQSFEIIASSGGVVGSAGNTDHCNGQLWWKDNAGVKSYGSPHPQLPRTVYMPYAGTGTTNDAVLWVTPAKLWVADNNTLLEFKTGSATSVSWYSRYVNLGQVEEIEEVKLYLAANLASGYEVSVAILNEVGTSTTIATFDFTTYGAVNSIVLHANQLTNAIANLTGFQARVIFTGGAARVREVVLKTKPVAQP